MAAHLSALAGPLGVLVATGRPAYWAGTVVFVGPLAVFFLLGGRDGPLFVAAHLREALNFNLSVSLYGLLVAVALFVTSRSAVTVQLVLVLLFLGAVLTVNWLVFILVAAARAWRGEYFEYPFTIRIVS